MGNKNWMDMCNTYDRTQGFKEYTQPIIIRTSALSQSLELIKLFGIEVSVVDLFNIQTEMFNYLETGETKVFKTLHDKTKGKTPLPEDKPNK